MSPAFLELTPDIMARSAGNGHVSPAAGLPENLNLVPLEHVDHPFPRWMQRVCDPTESAQNDKNFRNPESQNLWKEGRQNFRNPHLGSITAHSCV